MNRSLSLAFKVLGTLKLVSLSTIEGLLAPPLPLPPPLPPDAFKKNAAPKYDAVTNNLK